jgi:hypothetical protein
MKKGILAIGCGGIVLTLATTLMLVLPEMVPVEAQANRDRAFIPASGFEVEVLTEGKPLAKYFARGKTYIEAMPGSEYEIRIRNPLPYRVAVALSVDGLNSIDARRASAWNASKWVIAPYETIYLQGWQMSSSRARRFYFTSEQDSYAAKLGVTSDLGVISAVFFRESRQRPLQVMPPSSSGRGREPSQSKNSDTASSRTEAQEMGRERRGTVGPVPDDEYAATGIGRSVKNDVQWVSMDLDRQPAGAVTIRYEYYDSLMKLGVIPRRHGRPDPLVRREQSTGFENQRFSPEP